MTSKLHYLSLALLGAVSPVWGATSQSLLGGSGIGYMRTAEVMHQGESVWFLNSGLDVFNSATPGVTASLSTATLGYAASIGGHTELGIMFPYAIYTPDTTGATTYGGSRDTRAYLKHSLTYPGKQDGFAAAVTLYGSLAPSNPAYNVSSGESQFGGELNISHWAQDTAIHLSIGSETSDVWSELTTPPFASDRQMTAALGIEVGLSTAMGLTIETVSTTSAATAQGTMLLAAVFQYMPNKYWAFTMGAAQGASAATAFPATSMAFGITYSPTGQYQSRYARAAEYVDYYDLTKDLQKQVEALNHQVELLQQRLQGAEVRLEETEKEVQVRKHDYSKEYPASP